MGYRKMVQVQRRFDGQQKRFAQKTTARRSRNHKGRGVGVSAYRRMGILDMGAVLE